MFSLSLFYNSDVKVESLSRFSQKKEAKKIIEILEELQAKESELKKSSDILGVDSLDYAKYKILSKILSNINDSISNFNKTLALSDSMDELRNFINLLRELGEKIKEIYQNREYKDTLSQFRHKDKDNAYGIWGVIGAAFVYSSLPQTCLLLSQLLTTLDLTVNNLILTMNLSQLTDHQVRLSDEDNMICPITRELMVNPYICTLDGYSYEKEELEKWLYQYKTSPVTRKPMKYGASVEDVMIQNRYLKHIIDNYKLYRYAEMHKTTDDKLLIMTK
jgi:hypothetical protein